jgi:hypothetical protein
MSTTQGGPGNIVKNGIIMYLDVANPNSYVSGSTSWNDLSRGGNTGTLINGPTFNSGNGGSVVFDGVDDYVKGNSIFSALNGTNKLSLSMWINVTDLLSNRILFHIPKNLTASNSQVLIFLRTTGVLDISVNSTGTYCRSITGSVTSNIWTNININFDLSQASSANRIRPYVNGVDVFSVANNPPTSFPVSTGEYWLGEEANGYLAPFKGNISNLILYNRVLTTSEIQQNFNATRYRFGV